MLIYLHLVKIFKSILFYFNILSLDVVIGAMAGLLFFADLLGVTVFWEVYLLLGMAVWCIYSIDHLMDSRTIKNSKVAFPRHVFHKRYFKTILTVVLLFAVVGFVLMLFMEKLLFLFKPGFLLSTLIVVWFAVLYKSGQKAAWLKEISTALVYVSGIALAPVLLKGIGELTFHFWLFASIYFAIALLNLFILSHTDAKVDHSEGSGSILSVISKNVLEKFIFWIGLLLFILLVGMLIYLPSYFKMHTGILLLIVGLHLLYFFSKNQKKEALRQKLEASFMIPLILLIF